MKHDDAQIGLEFLMGGARWRCTDVGTRTICAIKLDARSPDWLHGPPYAVPEHCIDEYDLEACQPIAEGNLVTPCDPAP